LRSSALSWSIGMAVINETGSGPRRKNSAEPQWPSEL
jgi:hypothetical protein